MHRCLLYKLNLAKWESFQEHYFVRTINDKVSLLEGSWVGVLIFGVGYLHGKILIRPYVHERCCEEKADILSSLISHSCTS